jgi:site-specific DNA-methyltransferase (adenine-specific)
MWIYGSGFPKSANLGKAIDKKQGNKRIKTGQIKTHARKGVAVAEERTAINAGSFGQEVKEEITVGTSEWEGWGTALKPAHEPICMARKPLSEKSIADNVLKHRTGGINIDGCRVTTDENISNHSRSAESAVSKGIFGDSNEQETHQTDGQKLGRFPANLIHDGSDEVIDEFKKFGEDKGAKAPVKKKDRETNLLMTQPTHLQPHEKYDKVGDDGESFRGDTGTAARFFYCPKANKKEKGDSKHPTVKPVNLMRYLVRLVTPKDGIVLDPFAGTGTTGEACILENRNYYLIEAEESYIKDIENRINKYNRLGI